MVRQNYQNRRLPRCGAVLDRAGERFYCCGPGHLPAFPASTSVA